MASPSNKLRFRLLLGLALFVALASTPQARFLAAAIQETPYVTRAEAAMVLLLSRMPVVPSLMNDGRFTDLKTGRWYESYVLTAEKYGILRADPLRRIRPEAAVNRAEFVKMMAFTFGLPLNLAHGFRDVSSMNWYAPYAGLAYQYKLFPINSKNPLLAPGNPLTHEEASRAIQALFNARGTNFPSLENLAETRKLAAERTKPYLFISSLQEEVTIRQSPEVRQKRPPKPRGAPLLPEPTFEDVLSVRRLADLRAEMVQIVNEKRKAVGLLPLTESALLEGSAQKYAEKMADQNFFGHESPDGQTLKTRIEDSGYYEPFFDSDCNCEQTYVLGENLGRGQKTVQEAIEAWMNSPPHRRALFHPAFTDLGIGIAAGYWVQHFGGVRY